MNSSNLITFQRPQFQIPLMYAFGDKFSNKLTLGNIFKLQQCACAKKTVNIFNFSEKMIVFLSYILLVAVTMVEFWFLPGVLGLIMGHLTYYYTLSI